MPSPKNIQTSEQIIVYNLITYNLSLIFIFKLHLITYKIQNNNIIKYKL